MLVNDWGGQRLICGGSKAPICHPLTAALLRGALFSTESSSQNIKVYLQSLLGSSPDQHSPSVCLDCQEHGVCFCLFVVVYTSLSSTDTSCSSPFVSLQLNNAASSLDSSSSRIRPQRAQNSVFSAGVDSTGRLRAFCRSSVDACEQLISYLLQITPRTSSV